MAQNSSRSFLSRKCKGQRESIVAYNNFYQCIYDGVTEIVQENIKRKLRQLDTVLV